jgi:F420-dependent oxidoreductase-like protein
MRVCLMIEGQEDVTWDQWKALALACEEHGFEGLFRSDHYVSFGHPADWGSLDAWTTLGSLATLTDRIRLGTLVSPVTFRHPSLLAKAVVTADHASGGRVELGMGAGWFEAEHRAYGFPFPSDQQRFDLLTEQVEIVHRLWSRDEDAVTFEGRHYRLEDCSALPKPLQEPHPPLILGGAAGPRAVRLAARWADEYNVNFVAPGECARRRDRLFRALEAEGRDPATFRFSLMTGIVIGVDRQALLDRAWRLMDRRGESGVDPAAFLDRLSEPWIRGTPDQVLERLSQYRAAGIDRVMLQHLLHDDLETVALLGEQVIAPAADL